MLSVAVISFSLLPLTMFVFSLMGRQFFLAELLNNFRCQIMFLLLPFVFFLLLLRQWWLGLLFTIALAWSMVGIAWVYFPAAQPTPGTETLKVVLFNVYFGNPTPNLAIERILEHDPDIIAVIEYSNHFPEAFETLHEKYPYRVLEPRWHGFGIALFSRWPLSDTEIHYLVPAEIDCPMIEASVELEGQSVRLLCLHVASPTNAQRLQLRNQQFKQVAGILNQKKRAAIVMGDFNCTPWSSFLVEFLNQTGLRDSRQGFGYQATWHRDLGIFKIPIDHAFVSAEIHVHDRFVAEPAGSDHLPVVFEISVAPKRQE